MKSIQKEKGKPAYLQLYTALREAIESGAYPPGSRLPSKRQLCADTRLSAVTVEHAVALLCEEGYAEARQRSGVYVLPRSGRFRPSPETHRTASVQKTESGAAAFPMSVLSRAMRRTLSDWGERILEQSPHNGCMELRQALAAYLSRSRGISAVPEQIVVGSGAEYLYSQVVQLLGRDRLFSLEDPSYEKIRRVYEANGAECELLEMDEEGVTPAALEAAKGSVLHVTPFHSYPSGVSASGERRRAYLRWAEQRQGYVVEDDFDSEFTLRRQAEETVFSLSEEGRVIYLNTFSRTIAPSLRIGYMLLPVPLLEEYERKLGFYACTVPVFEQFLLAELLQSGDFERHINRVRRRLRREAENGEDNRDL